MKDVMGFMDIFYDERLRKVFISILIFCFVLVNLHPISFAEGSPDNELKVVPFLDLERFQGIWYEIAHNPWFVEKDCYSMIAHYRLSGDGKIGITNVCRKEGFDGEVSEISGKGWVVEPETPAKLEVQFIWPFTLDYWVIDLEKNYQYAVVGEPDKENVWILSRTPLLDRDILLMIMKKIEDKGYDLSNLVRTPQDPLHSRKLAQCIEASELKSDIQAC